MICGGHKLSSLPVDNDHLSEWRGFISWGWSEERCVYRNYQALSISAAEAFQSRETVAFAADSEFGFLTKKAVCEVGRGSDFTCNTPFMKKKSVSFSSSSPLPKFSPTYHFPRLFKEAAAAMGESSQTLNGLLILTEKEWNVSRVVIWLRWPNREVRMMKWETTGSHNTCFSLLHHQKFKLFPRLLTYFFFLQLFQWHFCSTKFWNKFFLFCFVCMCAELFPSESNILLVIEIHFVSYEPSQLTGRKTSLFSWFKLFCGYSISRSCRVNFFIFLFFFRKLKGAFYCNLGTIARHESMCAFQVQTRGERLCL